MKKILIFILILSFVNIAFAETQTFDDGTTLNTTTYDDGSKLYEAIDTEGKSTYSSSPSTDGNGTASKSVTMGTTIFTSEKVPGANCVCVADGATRTEDINGNTMNPGIGEAACSGEVSKRKYQCTLPTGLAGFQSILAQIIRWVINIVLLLGVLAVVGLGIAWSFAGGDDIKAKSTLKKWAINIIIGLIILFFFKYILAFLAPWVYQ